MHFQPKKRNSQVAYFQYINLHWDKLPNKRDPTINVLLEYLHSSTEYYEQKVSLKKDSDYLRHNE